MPARLHRHLLIIATLAALAACRAQPASEDEIAAAEQAATAAAEAETAAAALETDDPAGDLADDDADAVPAPPTPAYVATDEPALDDEPKDSDLPSVAPARDMRVTPAHMATPSRAVLTPRTLDTHRLRAVGSPELTGRPMLRPTSPAQGTTLRGARTASPR